MVLISKAHEPSPFIAPSLLDLGQDYLQRRPSPSLRWQQQGYNQALSLQQLTEQFCQSIEGQPNSASLQLQALRIIGKRRDKDLKLIADNWEHNYAEPVVGFCQTFEQLIYEYRWHQRAYQCLAWMLELQSEINAAKIFQSCSDNLYFDLGFLQLAQARSLTRQTP